MSPLPPCRTGTQKRFVRFRFQVASQKLRCAAFINSRAEAGVQNGFAIHIWVKRKRETVKPFKASPLTSR